MNSCATLICLLLCIVAVTARHATKATEGEPAHVDELQENIKKARELAANEFRHNRRKRQGWHASYGYNNYPQQGYYNDRRDYDRNDDVYPQILRLLDDIKDYLRRPPPQPQPIYVPYPVPYPVPQYTQVCSCPGTSSKQNMTVGPRFPILEDPGINWGYASEEDIYTGGSTGSRPINFGTYAPPDDITKKPAVPTTERPSMSQARTPDLCDAAVLTCCSSSKNPTSQRRCFSSQGCESSYRSNSCSQKSIAAVIALYSSQYVQN